MCEVVPEKLLTCTSTDPSPYPPTVEPVVKACACDDAEDTIPVCVDVLCPMLLTNVSACAMPPGSAKNRDQRHHGKQRPARRAAGAGDQEAAGAPLVRVTVDAGRLATPRWRRGAGRVFRKGVGLRP